MNYGITYQGSKSGIAEDIIDLLPAGIRFVDLFGGGAAMSHCAYISGKYKQISADLRRHQSRNSRRL